MSSRILFLAFAAAFAAILLIASYPYYLAASTTFLVYLSVLSLMNYAIMSPNLVGSILDK